MKSQNYTLLDRGPRLPLRKSWVLRCRDPSNMSKCCNMQASGIGLWNWHDTAMRRDDHTIYRPYKICKWYVQISNLNTPRCVAMTACVNSPIGACTAARHMPSWQLAYWRPQSLQHITGYVQSAKFADLDQLTLICNQCYTLNMAKCPSLHRVTLSNTLTITQNLSPTLTINPNTNHSPNHNKIIIIDPTVLRALVTHCKSVCTGTVTHSDRTSERIIPYIRPYAQDLSIANANAKCQHCCMLEMLLKRLVHTAHQIKFNSVSDILPWSPKLPPQCAWWTW